MYCCCVILFSRDRRATFLYCILDARRMRYTTQSVMQSVTINNSVGRIFGAGRRAKLRTWSLPVMSSLCYAARHIRSKCEKIVTNSSFYVYHSIPDPARHVLEWHSVCERASSSEFSDLILLHYYLTLLWRCNVFVIFVYGLVKGFARFSLANPTDRIPFGRKMCGKHSRNDAHRLRGDLCMNRDVFSGGGVQRGLGPRAVKRLFYKGFFS